MYIKTPQQTETEKSLNADGFYLWNWAPVKGGNHDEGTMIMMRCSFNDREYCEIDVDGSVHK